MENKSQQSTEQPQVHEQPINKEELKATQVIEKSIPGINLETMQSKLEFLNVWKNQNPKSEIAETIKYVKDNCGLTEDELIYLFLSSNAKLIQIRQRWMRMID